MWFTLTRGKKNKITNISTVTEECFFRKKEKLHVMHAHLYKIAVNQFNAVTIIKIGMKFASSHRPILFNYAIRWSQSPLRRIQSPLDKTVFVYHAFPRLTDSIFNFIYKFAQKLLIYVVSSSTNSLHHRINVSKSESHVTLCLKYAMP